MTEPEHISTILGRVMARYLRRPQLVPPSLERPEELRASIAALAIEHGDTLTFEEQQFLSNAVDSLTARIVSLQDLLRVDAWSEEEALPEAA